MESDERILLGKLQAVGPVVTSSIFNCWVQGLIFLSFVLQQVGLPCQNSLLSRACLGGRGHWAMAPPQDSKFYIRYRTEMKKSPRTTFDLPKNRVGPLLTRFLNTPLTGTTVQNT